MKKIFIKINAIIPALLFLTFAENRSSAQSNVETNAEALKFSHEIETRVSDFEMNAWEIGTNNSILDSQKAMDKDFGGAQNSIEWAIHSLRFTQINMSREEKTILWFDVLGAIDRHLGRIPGITLNRPIRPPPGYKGRVGPGGMEMPDTNDIADYKYYMAARRAVMKNSMDRIFQGALHGENNDEATPYSEQFFRSSYTSDADKREFENLLEHSELSDARKKALKAAVIGGQK